MNLQTSILFLLGFAVSSTTARCWFTECQPNGLEVRGCSSPGNETGTPPLDCRGGRGLRGIQYYCCSSNSSGPSFNEASVVELITFSQFQQALTKNGYKPPSQDQYKTFIQFALPFGGILDSEEAAMALAHIIYESDGLERTHEKVSGPPRFSFTSRCILPDQAYDGKGYIKLSGCNNYFIASQAIFGDFRLHEDPYQVANNESVAWATSLYIWGERAHSIMEVQQGKFGASIKEISENECRNQNDSSAKKRYKIYGIVRQAFGLPGRGDPSGCKYKFEY